MSLIEARGLSKTYGDAVVLDRVDLAIEPGEFVTLVGASGCGKSTFLRLLLSWEEPTRGVLAFDGAALPPEPDATRGIVFQRYSVFPHLTVEENLIVAAELSGSRLGRLWGAKRRAARESVAGLVDEIGLGPARNRYPAQLSGGMQQRVAIAQALTMRPRLLLLDEPFGALDPGIRADMHRLLTGLWREHAMTVLMVTHDIEEAFKLGTRILVFDKRRHDPHAPERFGSTITYDLPLDREARRAEARAAMQLETAHAA